MASPVRGLVLLLLLAFGGAGTSVLDAVIYHRHGAPEVQRPHVEAAGTEHHADRCGLSHPAPAPKLQAAPASAVAPLAPAVLRPKAPAAAVPVLVRPVTTQHQRAPPPSLLG